MRIPDRIRVEHIDEAISEIESYIAGVTEEEFRESSLIRSATIRQFEIIGEAANAVSEEFENQHPEIPWRLWANFRNVLIHQYFGVDYAEVYKTVQNDMPELKSHIRNILSHSQAES
ncbi:MAG: hypothetical protein DRI57_09210 [Deltaproteobacteria bacterium]|nr:MAG: hypothetical protein DRI57_09210 [Deltaproteobacteria bacterium]